MYGNNSKTGDWKGENRQSKNSIQQIDCEKTSSPNTYLLSSSKVYQPSSPNVFIGDPSNLSSPTRLGIQCLLLFVIYLFEKEILPGFRIKCGMTSLLSSTKAQPLSSSKSFIEDPGQIFISTIKNKFSRGKNINTLSQEDRGCHSRNLLSGIHSSFFFFCHSQLD